MKGLAIATFVAASTASAAASDEDCVSKFTKFDVCNTAKEFQAELAPILPMRMNKNVTVSRSAAIGPELIMYATWDQTDAELNERLTLAGMTKDNLIHTMNSMARSTVCGQEETAAFVRLGGRMSYHYATSDAVPVTMITIDECPRN